LKGEIIMHARIFTLLAALAALSACTGSMTKPTATEADFGNSAASLIKAQTANPAAAANPSPDPVTGVDPDYANNVIDALREAVSDPAQVREDIAIQVGSQGQGGK
jgi:ABC-type amino acid transport substrate-binding protein